MSSERATIHTRLWHARRGTTMAQYALIIGLVSLASVAALEIAGNKILKNYCLSAVGIAEAAREVGASAPALWCGPGDAPVLVDRASPSSLRPGDDIDWFVGSCGGSCPRGSRLTWYTTQIVKIWKDGNAEPDDGTQLSASYTLDNAPDWLSVTDTGVVTGTVPINTSNNNIDVTITASSSNPHGDNTSNGTSGDGSGSESSRDGDQTPTVSRLDGTVTDTASFTIPIDTTSPSWSTNAGKQFVANSDGTFTGTLDASDSDGEAFFEFVGSPDGVSLDLNNVTGDFVGTAPVGGCPPSNPCEFTCSAVDEAGNRVQRTFIVIVGS